ncbi:MAG: hypothetical protein AAGL68_06715 [Pseudomonadota bacterium]
MKTSSVLPLLTGLLALTAPASASEENAAPHTQTANNGSYWGLYNSGAVAAGRETVYREIENLCLTTDGRRYFGIHPAVGDQPAFAVTEGGALPVTIGPVDASAGKRHYKISNPENPEEFLMMNFIAPGMREQELPSATAGLLSITSGEEYQIDCVDNDRIVMMAAFEKSALIVTLEDGDMILREADTSSASRMEVRGGLFSSDANGSIFHFFDDDRRVSIDLSAAGLIREEAIVLESLTSRDSAVPEVYFLANPQMLAERAPTISPETGSMINRLSTCNHFAGEASEDAERNAQIKVRWEELQCDAVPAQYASALAAAEDGSPLKTYLAVNSPNWM